MERKIPLHCPACESVMELTELTCPNCTTKVQGQFSVNPLLRLSKEQLGFVEVFVRCRGNIREVEREMGISYPTVRSRLDEVIERLGYHAVPADNPEDMDAISQFERGDLSFEQTLERLRRG